MILIALTLITAVLFVIFLGLTTYARWNYGILESSGAPVLKIKSFFLGSVPDLHLKIQTEEDLKRFKKYGPVFGLYEGRTPILHVCDPDLIRDIFVKDVEYFYDRRVGHFGDARIDEILDYLPGEKWRKMRKLQTILFSSGKIRQYSVQLQDAARDFVTYLKGKCDENGRVKVDTRNVMDIVSLDGIARVSFGIKLENVEDPNNLFYRGLKKLLGGELVYTALYSLSMVFPILHKLAPSFQIEDVLFDTFREIVQTRKQQRKLISTSTSKPGGKCNDLADFLVDCFDQLDSDDFKRLGISETTLLAQALNVTALDMISATMTMISYYLATHDDVQQKLHEELDTVIMGKYQGRIDNETVNDLPYLNACLNETLRLAPPLIRPERVCTRDWVSPDGSLKIKKGTVVMIPLYAAHRHPKYFPRAEEFVPERFLNSGLNSEENSEFSELKTSHPYAYSPFGLGPRNCIGMRLALETLKVNVAVLLKDFKIQLRSDTKFAFKPGMLFLLQFKPLYLDFVERFKN